MSSALDYPESAEVFLEHVFRKPEGLVAERLLMRLQALVESAGEHF